MLTTNGYLVFTVLFFLFFLYLVLYQLVIYMLVRSEAEYVDRKSVNKENTTLYFHLHTVSFLECADSNICVNLISLTMRITHFDMYCEVTVLH